MIQKEPDPSAGTFYNNAERIGRIGLAFHPAVRIDRYFSVFLIFHAEGFSILNTIKNHAGTAVIDLTAGSFRVKIVIVIGFSQFFIP